MLLPLGIAQKCCRMVRYNCANAVVVVNFAAQLGHTLFVLEQCVGRSQAQREYILGFDKLDLLP